MILHKKRHPIRSDLESVRWTSKIACYNINYRLYKYCNYCMILGMYFKLNFVWILQWFCTKKTSNQIWPWVHSLNFQKLHGQSSQYIYSIPNFYLYVCIFNWIFLFLWISYRICNDFAQKRHPIRSDLGFARWTSKNCMVKAVFIYCYPTSRGATAHTPKLGFFCEKENQNLCKKLKRSQTASVRHKANL